MTTNDADQGRQFGEIEPSEHKEAIGTTLMLVPLERDEIKLLVERIESRYDYEYRELEQLEYYKDWIEEHGSIEDAISFHKGRLERLTAKLERLKHSLPA